MGNIITQRNKENRNKKLILLFNIQYIFKINYYVIYYHIYFRLSLVCLLLSNKYIIIDFNKMKIVSLLNLFYYMFHLMKALFIIVILF